MKQRRASAVAHRSESDRAAAERDHERLAPAASAVEQPRLLELAERGLAVAREELRDRRARAPLDLARRGRRTAARAARRRSGPSVVLPAPMKPMSARWRSSAFSGATGSARGTRGARRRSRRSRRRRTSPGRRARARTRPRPRRRPRAPRPPAMSLRSTSASPASPVSRSTESQRPHQRRQRLHRGADDDLLAVRDAGLEPARAVRLAPVAVLVAQDLVVRLASRAARASAKPSPISTPLTAWMPISAAASRASSRSLLRRVGAEPGRHARARAPRRRRRACRGRPCAASTVARGSSRPPPTSSAAPATSIPISRSSAFATAPAATCDRGVARARALERVADVVVAVLEDAGEVGVPGPRQRDGLRALAVRLALGRPRAHPPRPVLVVAVADDERERRAERASVAEAGEHLDLVGLDLLARAAAVALLAAAQVGVDRVAVEQEPGGQAGDDRDERGPVRLAGGDERSDIAQAYSGASHVGTSVTARRPATSTGGRGGIDARPAAPRAGPVQRRSNDRPAPSSANERTCARPSTHRLAAGRARRGDQRGRPAVGAVRRGRRRVWPALRLDEQLVAAPASRSR